MERTCALLSTGSTDHALRLVVPFTVVGPPMGYPDDWADLAAASEAQKRMAAQVAAASEAQKRMAEQVVLPSFMRVAAEVAAASEAQKRMADVAATRLVRFGIEFAQVIDADSRMFGFDGSTASPAAATPDDEAAACVVWERWWALSTAERICVAFAFWIVLTLALFTLRELPACESGTPLGELLDSAETVVLGTVGAAVLMPEIWKKK
jgi:hypothetical protein